MSTQTLSALASFYKVILALDEIDGVDRSDLMTETLMDFDIEWDDLMEYLNF
jgi:hypothetical protein